PDFPFRGEARKHLLVLSLTASEPEADHRGGSNQHPASLNGKTARSWRDIVFLYAPRTGGAYESHHRTTGIAGCTRRRGGGVAAGGARAAQNGGPPSWLRPVPKTEKRVDGGPPLTKSGTETKAQMARVNADKSVEHRVMGNARMAQPDNIPGGFFWGGSKGRAW